MRIGIIGTGKIGIGPLACHSLFASSQKILINRKTKKWDDVINKGYLIITNIADNYSEKVPVITKEEELRDHVTDDKVIFLYEDEKEYDKLLKSLDVIFISVGKNVEDVVLSLPSLECPVILAENDYDTIIRLMRENENDIYASVIDCHSSMYEFCNNHLKMSYGRKMHMQILDDKKRIRSLFSVIPSEVTFCDGIRELDIYHLKKFYGINLTHRLLVYLLLKEQYDRHDLFVDDDVAIYYSELLYEKYITYAKAVIVASYIEDAVAIQKFYNVDTFEEGFDVYTSILINLADSIARKTRDTGDKFSRVVKFGTEDYHVRLNQTKNVIDSLMNTVDKEMVGSVVDDRIIKDTKDALSEIMALLKTVGEYQKPES